MKIILATHKTSQRLGVSKYFYLLGKYLTELGVEVRIIVDSQEGVPIVQDVFPEADIVVLNPESTTAINTAQYCWNLSRYLTEHLEFDILHCGHVLPFFYLMRRNRKPVIFQPFGNELFTLAGRGISRWYCRIAQPVLRYCGEKSDILLSEGEFQHQDMCRWYPKARGLRVLPVGVDMSAVSPKSDYEAGKPFRFLAVNSLLPYEGMEELIRAFWHVYTRHNEAQLTIVGAGPLAEKLKQMANGFPVSFLKNISEYELSILYEESDAFVCTTEETDFQMGVLEAMSFGLPVLCRDAVWLPDGILRFSRDVGDLSSKMADILLSTPARRHRMANEGLESIKPYDSSCVAKEAVKIYEEVLR